MAQIDHLNSTLCLAMKDASTAAGGRVIQQTCKEANEQMWQPVSRGLRDFVSGDSTDDILAVEYTNNKLWLYPGLGGAEFGTRLQRDTGGWHTLRDLAAGDFNNDGKDDLLAVHAATGNLRFYSGPDNTTQFRKHTVISAEFTGKNNLVGVDMSSLAGDELLVSDLATGLLSLLIVLSENTFRAWVSLATSQWNGYSEVVGGRFNREGIADVISFEQSTSKLW
jgi:resuscitation-promoting factor RpfA